MFCGPFFRNKRSAPPPAPKTKAEENREFAQELKRMGAT